jgi:uncharacterized protein with HEPN domain
VKEDRLYLVHIKDAIEQIRHYTRQGREAFLADRQIQDATIRNLEIIGEAVKHVSKKLRSAHPDIPWKRIAGMRDKMIHDYFGVDARLVWDVVERELPLLLRKVEEILSKPT